jgi:hypothetical protein
MISRVAPQAAARGGIPQQMQNGPPFGFGPGPGVFFGQFGPMDIGTELSNVPAAALPSILLFILLTVVYVVLLGPVSYFSLRRMRRRELLWVSIPAGALLCVAVTFGVAFHLKGNTVLINSVGFVQLDGSGGPTPVSLYVGLFAPVRGDYNLTYDSPALPATVPRFDYFGGPQQTSRPLGLRLQEGGQTQVQFLSMNMWSMRNVALHSMVNVPGGIKSQLHVGWKGYIVGAVHNDSALTLQHPAIIAGRTVYKLPDMGPEATIRVHLKPQSDIYDFNHDPIWYSLYGRPTMGQPIMAKTFFFNQGPQFGGGYCCGPVGMSAPPEHSMLDRIRNVASRLPEAQAVSSLGEVVFVGWTTQPLGTISVDGSSPQRRDLNLVESPLSVDFTPGPFKLRTGTLGARLVDISPSTTGNNFCCGPLGAQSVTLPQFGSATFEFDIPHGVHLRFTSLHLYVDAGGADGIDLGRVYDWQTSTWVHEDLAEGYAILKNPQRFVSPTGTILVKLQPGDYGNPGRIQDVHQDIQISGTGVAS